MFYFAYGSNMDLDQMCDRCGRGNFKVIGAGVILDYMLAFRRRSPRWCNMGVADLKQKKGKRTYGVIFEINDYALRQLDIHEGYREGRRKEINAYNRLEVDIKLIDSEANYKAYCYFANPEVDFIQPSRKYLDVLIKGAQVNNLPKEAIEDIKQLGKFKNV